MKASVDILSPELILLGRINDYEGLSYTRALADLDSKWELTINFNKNHVDKLIKGNVILINANPSMAGIIEYRAVTLDDNGGEVLTIQGYTLTNILSRRITIPPTGAANWTKKAPAETVLKELVAANFNSSPDSARHIDNLIIAPDQGRGVEISWSSRYKVLSEECHSIFETTEVGYSIELDYQNKQLVFDTIHGTDRTTAQTERSWVKFSTDLNNIGEQSYLDSSLDYKNMAYVAGQGEGVDRSVIEVMAGEFTGINRRELFVDARDLETDAALPARGQQKLDETKEIQTFEGIPLTNSTFVFERDYFLGDWVTVASRKWGITLHAQITSVTESWYSDGYELQVNFGSNIPTLSSKIRSIAKAASAN